MKTFTRLIALSTLVLVGTATAQDSGELVSALTKAKAKSLNGVAAVTEESPEQQKNSVFGNAMVMVNGMRGGGGAGAAFEGELEVFVNDGAIAAASVGKLPMVKVYKQGSKTLFSQVHDGNSVDTSSLALLLSRALNMDTLISEIERASRVRSKEIDGGKSYRVTIEGDYFDQDADGDDSDDPMAQAQKMAMSGMQQSIIEGVLSVQVDDAGELKSLQLEVQYNNPMADIMTQAMKGGARAQVKIQGLTVGGKPSTTPGKKVTLKFEVSDQESSAAQAFAKEASELLK